jgi:hypothetical protein
MRHIHADTRSGGTHGATSDQPCRSLSLRLHSIGQLLINLVANPGVVVPLVLNKMMTRIIHPTTTSFT